jgi:hypothetical protein
MIDESQSQHMLLNLINDLEFMTHFIIVNISNSPENLSRGARYPYFTVTFNALDKHF